MSRIYLTAPQTWYVDLAGSDTTGDGSATHPWATATFAMQQIAGNYDLGGQAATLKINDGSWSVPSGSNTFCACNGQVLGSLLVKIVGNIANPAACQINLAAGQYGFSMGNKVVVTIDGFQFNCPSGNAIPLFASNYGAADFGNMIFGPNLGGINCFSLGLGTLLGYADCSIIGNAAIHFAAQGGGQLKSACNINIPTALAFTQFAQTNNQGLMDITHMTYTGAGVAGCTGQKGNASMVSTITINGNTNAAPGNGGWVHDATSAIA